MAPMKIVNNSFQDLLSSQIVHVATFFLQVTCSANCNVTEVPEIGVGAAAGSTITFFGVPIVIVG